MAANWRYPIFRFRLVRVVVFLALSVPVLVYRIALASGSLMAELWAEFREAVRS